MNSDRGGFIETSATNKKVMTASERWFKKFYNGKMVKKKTKHIRLFLLLDNGGSDHLVEGVVFAFARRCDVHGGGADVLLLEAGLEQMRHLGFLRIIDRRCEAACTLYLPKPVYHLPCNNYEVWVVTS